MSDEQYVQQQDAIFHPPLTPLEANAWTSTAYSRPAGTSHTPGTHTMPLPALRTTMSLPPFETLNRSARDDTTIRNLLEPVARSTTTVLTPTVARSPSSAESSRGQGCVCLQIKPLVSTACQLVRKLKESTQRRVPEAEYDEFLGPVCTSLQSMQWIVEQLTVLESISRSNKGSPLERRFVDSTSVYKRAAPLKNDSSPLDRSQSPSKRIRTESTAAAHQHGSTSPLQSRRRSPPPYSREKQFEIGQPHAQSADSTHHRMLPSPSSSSAHPLAASMQPSRVASSASPSSTTATSGPSLHNASMTPVASEYIADLQHQITLKSLALQSLQAEHTNLLQKMHRETVKFQAVEKKSQVADQEINELLTKNDELIDQIKEFNVQVTNLERRREEEVQAMAREKEQWGRMLDMSGRLQRKAEEDRRLLQEDNTRLEDRILWYERESEACHHRNLKTPLTNPDEGTATAMLHPETSQSDLDHVRPNPTQKDRDHDRLHHHPAPPSVVDRYQSQIEQLRSTLIKVRRQNTSISEKAQELRLQREELSSAIELALSTESPASRQPTEPL